ncbi:MAG: ATP-binding cassette domain-containing protein, partial [Candidatus Rokubacteria bacterium]|nr:ATP-binding cassette domain-containing protein [Candidatus Rokubacteria bacterium]
MTVPLLVVDQVSAGYQDLLVLKSCSLEVREGEFVALVGPNGAGKSTLLRTITGLLVPRAGSIYFQGERIDGRPPYEIAARGLTLIPEGRRLFAPLTVQENMELGAFLPRAHPHREETLRHILR